MLLLQPPVIMRQCRALLQLLALLALSAPTQALHNFTDCGSPALIPRSLSLTPDPPAKGGKWAIGFTATPTRTITNGTLDVIVSIWGIPISHKLDICKVEDGWPGCPFDAPVNITDWNPAIPKASPHVASVPLLNPSRIPRKAQTLAWLLEP